MKDTRSLVWIAVAALAAGMVIGFAVGHREPTVTERMDQLKDWMERPAASVRQDVRPYVIDQVSEPTGGGPFDGGLRMIVSWSAPGNLRGVVSVPYVADWSDRADKEIRKEIAGQRAKIAKAERLKAELQGKAKP